MNGHDATLAAAIPVSAADSEKAIEGCSAREKRSKRVFLAFMRGELLGPIDAMIGLSRLLRDDARALERPADFLADVESLCEHAESLYRFVEDSLALPPADGDGARNGDGAHSGAASGPAVHPASPDFQAALRNVRHDIGNKLVPVSAALQFLREDEDRTFFGGLSNDLARIHAYFKECEAKLLKFRGEAPGSADEEYLEAPAAVVLAGRVADAAPDVALDRCAAGSEEGSTPNFAVALSELPTPGGRILVADDDSGSREFLSRLLRKANHDVHLAADGIEALRLMNEIDFDVALVDIIMPGKDGFEVLAELKRDRFAHIPVLMISGLGQMDDVLRAIKMGAHDYLPKPVNQHLVRARVNACVEQMRMRERELCRFFTPDIARRIARRPDCIQQGTEADVSVLFCDIRGFSRISEHLAAQTTVRWVADVMNTLSECVLKNRGTLVDYIGDELMAMWGAPEPQADHALLACRAALDMQSRLPEINRRWLPAIGRPTTVGVGINSGSVHVGNTGSERRFKYGPLGSAVNLASRVQSATKFLQSDILITGETRRRIGDALPTRRLSKVRVRNIRTPVDLCELFSESDGIIVDLRESYEEALEHFEREDFRGAMEILGPLVAFHPDDGPSMLLMNRIIESRMRVERGETNDAVWTLP